MSRRIWLSDKWFERIGLVAGVVILVIWIVGFVLLAIDFEPSAAVECGGPIEQYCEEPEVIVP